jgi:glycosyltransferase involved in cell wall biosynthesis
VEAAACGTPVIVTTASPLPELLGEGAIAVSPQDPGGWIEAMARVLSDEHLRRKMSAAGLAATAKLSWENSARQLLGVFSEVQRVAAA